MAKTYAELAFDTYNNHGPNAGKTYDGKPIPPWDAIAKGTQERWEAAAKAVAQAAERALLDDFTAALGETRADGVGVAFEAALKRYYLACALENGPLELRVLFSMIAEELTKASSTSQASG